MNFTLENICYTYDSPFTENREALKNISMTISSREILAIAGGAGSGKTTLIQHLNGLLTPTTGSVTVNGMDLSHKSTDLQSIRKRVGIVFQFPERQLFEETVYRDVAYGPKNLGLTQSEIDLRVKTALKLVGLEFEQFAEKSPFNLSGGEKRRAAIAGIIAMEPDVLVLDEPTVGLDKRSADMIESIIHSMNRSGRTIIFVSHNMDMVARVAEKAAVLSEGELIYHGDIKTLFADPEIIQKAGLELPGAARFLLELKQKGYQVKTDIFTVEEARNEIKRIAAAGAIHRN